jgi:hypothetical protein
MKKIIILAISKDLFYSVTTSIRIVIFAYKYCIETPDAAWRYQHGFIYTVYTVVLRQKAMKQ